MSFLTRRHEKKARKEAEQFAVGIGIPWTDDLWWITFPTPTLPTVALFITDDEIICAYRQPAAFGEDPSASRLETIRVRREGAQASIDASGTHALTRVWPLEARRDRRQIYLTIEGTGDPIVIRVQPPMEYRARLAAARINSRPTETEEAAR